MPQSFTCIERVWSEKNHAIKIYNCRNLLNHKTINGFFLLVTTLYKFAERDGLFNLTMPIFCSFSNKCIQTCLFQPMDYLKPTKTLNS